MRKFASTTSLHLYIVVPTNLLEHVLHIKLLRALFHLPELSHCQTDLNPEKIFFVDPELEPSKLDAIDFDLTCMVTNEMYTCYLQILPVVFLSYVLLLFYGLVVK